MRPRLHALILAAVILVFGASFVLLSRVIGVTSPWLVLLLMFYFLGIAKVAEPLFTMRMPSALRPLGPWEREGSFYHRVGVLGFGRLLRQTPLRYLNAAVYLDRERRQFSRIRDQAESAEATHFWAAVVFMPYVALAAIGGNWNVVAWFLLAQMLVNVYPILHLRHVRGRLDRVLGRFNLEGQRG